MGAELADPGGCVGVEMKRLLEQCSTSQDIDTPLSTPCSPLESLLPGWFFDPRTHESPSAWGSFGAIGWGGPDRAYQSK